MSTHTPEAHFEYTMNEWKQHSFQNYLNIIFEKDDIDICYDIGANSGAVTQTILNFCEQNNKNLKKIYCFEPDADNFLYLKNKLKQYTDKGIVKCINEGIYYGKKKALAYNFGGPSITGTNELYMSCGGYSIDECAEQIKKIRNARGENVICGYIKKNIFSLNELENMDISKPDLVKIDVEGAEKNILENSSLIKNSKYIILEWNFDLKLDTFLEKYLPNHKIILQENDVLIQKM